MSVLNLSYKQSNILVSCSYGDQWGIFGSPQTFNCSNAKTIITLDGEDPFVSVPELEYKPTKITIGFREEKAKLILPREISSFTRNISSGEPHSRVLCSIMKRISDPRGVESPVLRYLFTGEAVKVLRNYRGRRDIIALEIAQHKEFLRNARLGIIAQPSCNRTLGDHGCQVNIAEESKIGTITEINNQVVTITGLPGRSTNFWEKGFIRRNGVSIVIKEWEQGDVFTLVRTPPQRWLNQSIYVAPGCNKFLETCRTRWNNEKRFLGPGLRMPAYHPIYEKGF